MHEHGEIRECKAIDRKITLIAALLLLLLLAGFSIGLLLMVNTEQRVGGQDLNNNYTYHAAEGAMEKTSSDPQNLPPGTRRCSGT